MPRRKTGNYGDADRPTIQRKRLQQYALLSKKFSGWMIAMQKMDFSEDRSIEALALINRKTLRLKKLEEVWAQKLLGGIFGGTRQHTLMVDACLPLWSVYHGKSIFETWFYWSAGDIPAVFRKWCQQGNLINHSQPFCNGLTQAILWGSMKR